MPELRPQRLPRLLEPGLRRMLLFSFLLHLLVPLILSGVLKITHKTPQLPVYRVNLVNKPVKNPQAGRPDAAPETKKKPKPVEEKPAAVKIPAKKTPPPAPKPVAKKPPQPKMEKKPEPVAKPEPKPAPKPKPTPKSEPKIDPAAQQNLTERLAEMQAKAERQRRLDQLKAALAAQKAEIGRPDIQAPVGEPDGQGDEAGISSYRFIEGFIREQWRLSQYQLPRLDLQAEVRVTYSAAGMMRSWEWLQKSGNSQFDNSLRTAILKSRQLSQPLPEDVTFEITFNLKDLQN